MAHSTPVGGGLEQESVDQRQEKINDACSSLIKLGLSRELFALKNLHDHGFTVNDFLEYIKPLISMDLEQLSLLISLGNRFCALPLVASFRQFVDFIKWLNCEEGKKAKVDAATRKLKRNLEKKPIPQADVALAQMLVDYAASRKLARARIHEEIEELKRRKKELEMESASIDADLKTKLGPIYGYEEPSIFQVRIEAYRLYATDCWSKGITPIPKEHEMGFEKAMEGFGGTVKERYLVKYLNDPVRKEVIRDFFKQKILRMEYAGDDDKMQSGECFRNFAVAVSEEAFNQTENIVHVFDGSGRISGEPQPPDSKRARNGGNGIAKKV